MDDDMVIQDRFIHSVQTPTIFAGSPGCSRLRTSVERSKGILHPLRS